ncbi:MAG TPA: hypothetical protein DIT94_06165 [Deltaproteobacteria bacterium]|nr:hypothetical protein [Deltaproteobacteria bacterium]
MILPKGFLKVGNLSYLASENLFRLLASCHSARRALMPEVAESTKKQASRYGFCDSALRLRAE